MLWYRIQLFYFRYQVNFALYMLSPSEKAVCNILVLLFFGVLVYFVLPWLFLSIPRIIIQTFMFRSVERVEIHDIYKVVDLSMAAARSTDLTTSLRWPISMQDS